MLQWSVDGLPGIAGATMERHRCCDGASPVAPRAPMQRPLALPVLHRSARRRLEAMFGAAMERWEAAMKHHRTIGASPDAAMERAAALAGAMCSAWSRGTARLHLMAGGAAHRHWQVGDECDGVVLRVVLSSGIERLKIHYTCVNQRLIKRLKFGCY